MATIQKKKQQVLTAVDYDILKLIHEYHFLTVSQITRLRYSPGSETTAQDRLKRLFDAGVLDRVQLPHVGTGNTEYLYTLSTKGQKELQSSGVASFSRFRPYDTHTLKLPHLQHLISLNDFLIAARLLSRNNPAISLVAMKHDLDMKRSPLRITIDKQAVNIVPDGFLDFRLSIAGCLYALPVWIEIDRGTEWGKQLKSKFLSIITAIHTQAFSDLFGVASVTVAIVTTDEKRVDLMRSFIQQELTSMGLPHLSNVFLFASLPVGVLNPREVFLTPIWYTPSHAKPIPLLDMSEE